jgi:hypothetical protein
MRTSATEWAERVEAWHGSGQTADVFAESNGYSAKLLRWWGSELARRSRRQAKVRTVPVVRCLEAREPLTVSVGAARIEVRAGFDRALLHELIDTLGGAR